MRANLYIVGVLLILSGGIWVLQGLNYLPGSFMTGQIRWAIYGTVAIVIGILSILFARRKNDQNE